MNLIFTILFFGTILIAMIAIYCLSGKILNKIFATKCQDVDCNKEATIKCFIQGNCSEIPNFQYCEYHAKEHGFCTSCGSLIAGTPAFEKYGKCIYCSQEFEINSEILK